MTSRHVLFVGQQDIANDLNHGFSSTQDSWAIEFASTGEAALDLLSNRHFDVIATELTLPDMAATKLLQKAQELFPGTIRLVFSAGHDRNPQFTHANAKYLETIGLGSQLLYLRSLAIAR